MSDLLNLIQKRRSIRAYTDQPISDQDLSEIIYAGLWAPSGTNLQPWYFAVCKSEASKAKMKALMNSNMEEFDKMLAQRFANNPEIVKETSKFVRSMGDSDVIVLAFLHKASLNDDHSARDSVSIAVHNMALVAAEKGIGSCMLTAPLHADHVLEQEFAPGKGAMVMALTLGYAAKEGVAPKRKPDRFVVL